MILYLDTSALVKLYVEEPGTDEVAALVEAASAVLTVRVAYAEARAAFARHRREGALRAGDLRRVVRELDTDWARYGIVEVNDAVVPRAGALAERHGLRAYDAVQLAAALDVRRAAADLAFVAYDARLVSAARAEGLAASVP